MLGFGQNKHVMDRVVHFENVLMTNLPRIAKLENRVNDMFTRMQQLESQLPSMDADIHDGIVVSLTAHGADGVPLLDEEAPAHDGLVLPPPAPATTQALPPGIGRPAAAPEPPAAAFGIARMNLLEQGVQSQ